MQHTKTTVSGLRRIIVNLFSLRTVLFLSVIGVTISVFAQENGKNTLDDEKLIEQLIQAKGTNTIVFKPSNVKQFWIDKTVVSRKNAFEILLNEEKDYKSVPMKVQLANVNETQDCIVDVLTDTPNVSFSVLDSKGKVLSNSNESNDFIQYKDLTSRFHLEDVKDYSFNLRFSSTSSPSVSVKAVVFSFSKNKDTHFMTSPGSNKITKDDIVNQANLFENDKDSFYVKDTKYKVLTTTNSYYATNHPISYSATFKNTGNVRVAVYLRYVFYSKNHVELGRENFPYNSNSKTLTVISAEKGSDRIVVDSFSEFEKNCCIALNVKDNMSDIPNTTLLDAKVIEVKNTSDGHTEILLDKKLADNLEVGTQIRIHGPYYHGGVMSPAITIQPDEEKVLSAEINKIDSFYLYSTKGIPEGVYYVKPMIISASDNNNISLLIRDFFVTF